MTRPNPPTTENRQTTQVLQALTAPLAVALLLLACSPGSPLNANAGPDITVTVGEAPHFDGCESEGDITNYKWSIVSTPPGNQEDLNKVIRSTDSDCSFTLQADMEIDEIGAWTIELTTTTESGASDTDQVGVHVSNAE